MQKMVTYGVKQDEKDVVPVWRVERYFEMKSKDKKTSLKNRQLRVTYP